MVQEIQKRAFARSALWPFVLVGAAALAVLFRLLPMDIPLSPAQPTTASLGLLLVRDMMLPFEAVSLALLAALVGAVHFTARSRKDEGGK